MLRLCSPVWSEPSIETAGLRLQSPLCGPIQALSDWSEQPRIVHPGQRCWCTSQLEAFVAESDLWQNLFQSTQACFKDLWKDGLILTKACVGTEYGNVHPVQVTKVYHGSLLPCHVLETKREHPRLTLSKSLKKRAACMSERTWTSSILSAWSGKCSATLMGCLQCMTLYVMPAWGDCTKICMKVKYNLYFSSSSTEIAGKGTPARWWTPETLLHLPMLRAVSDESFLRCSRPQEVISRQSSRLRHCSRSKPASPHETCSTTDKLNLVDATSGALTLKSCILQGTISYQAIHLTPYIPWAAPHWNLLNNLH